jgi:hypothetical protein
MGILPLARPSSGVRRTGIDRFGTLCRIDCIRTNEAIDGGG